MVLAASELRHYRKQGGAAEKASAAAEADKDRAKGVILLKPGFKLSRQEGEGALCFRMTTPERTWVLTADSTVELLAWLTAIQTCIERLTQQGQGHRHDAQPLANQQGL